MKKTSIDAKIETVVRRAVSKEMEEHRSEFAFVREQLAYIRQCLDIMLKTEALEERQHEESEATHAPT